MQLEVVVAGDPRLAENVVLEVRALAQRFGLGIPDVRIVSQPVVGPKTKKFTPPRHRSSQARRTFSPRSRT